MIKCHNENISDLTYLNIWAITVLFYSAQKHKSSWQSKAFSDLTLVQENKREHFFLSDSCASSILHLTP